VSVAGERDVVISRDGKVIAIENVPSARFIEGPCKKISNLHVGVRRAREPDSGLRHGPGDLLSEGKLSRCESFESKRGKRAELALDPLRYGDGRCRYPGGRLIARRIVCWPGLGDHVLQAERFGMIRFGSRMDVYVPEASEVLVSLGAHVYAGEKPSYVG